VIERFVGALASGAYPLTRTGGVRPYQLLDACARSPAIRKQYVALVREAIARLGEGLQGGRSDARSGAISQRGTWRCCSWPP